MGVLGALNPCLEVLRFLRNVLNIERLTRGQTRIVTTWSENRKPPWCSSTFTFIKCPGELLQWLFHDDSTIYIVRGIIIIIIIEKC